MVNGGQSVAAGLVVVVVAVNWLIWGRVMFVVELGGAGRMLTRGLMLILYGGLVVVLLVVVLIQGIGREGETGRTGNRQPSC